MHISSLWGEYSGGSFGKECFEFIDFLKQSGFSYWQVLPFVIPDECNSPYKSYSTFGGNPYFVNLDELKKDGLLTDEDLLKAKQGTPYYCEFDRLKNERLPLLIKASEKANEKLKKEIENFITENHHINEFCKFMALKKANNEKEWSEWTVKEYSEKIYFAWCFIQYEFFKQWAKVKKYANENGISIIGDIPIYVSFDSADVYYNRKMFLMDEENHLTEVAGVPPDYFSEDGQLWGNPLYDWNEMEKDGFSWWKERLEFSLKLFDGVRIDHFRGFESFWAVKGTEKTAKNGKWVKGPGMKLINVFNEVRGDRLIIAEDLGDITEEVVKLVSDSTFPGMRVFQFGFLSMWDTPHRPYNYVNNCVAYSGTHDNNTLLGYLWETDENMKKKVMEYCSCPYERWNEDGCFSIIKTIMASSAGLTIFPIQDLLGYGSDTRLNVPGRAENNWLYRVTKEQLNNIDRKKYKDLNELYGR